MTRRPACIWVTGLAGSGKTALSETLVSFVRASNKEIVWLDGDLIRDFMGARDAASYTQEGRKKLSRLYGEMCCFFIERGFSIVMSTVSMHPGVSEWNRANIPGYFEVFLSVPTETLINRNKNNMYSDVADVVGVDIEARVPESPDLIIEIGFSGASLDQADIRTAARTVLEKSGMGAVN